MQWHSDILGVYLVSKNAQIKRLWLFMAKTKINNNDECGIY